MGYIYPRLADGHTCFEVFERVCSYINVLHQLDVGLEEIGFSPIWPSIPQKVGKKANQRLTVYFRSNQIGTPIWQPSLKEQAKEEITLRPVEGLEKAHGRRTLWVFAFLGGKTWKSPYPSNRLGENSEQGL